MPAEYSQWSAQHNCGTFRSSEQQQLIPARHDNLARGPQWGQTGLVANDEQEQGDSLDAFVETRLVPVSLSQIPDRLPDHVRELCMLHSAACNGRHAAASRLLIWMPQALNACRVSRCSVAHEMDTCYIRLSVLSISDTRLQRAQDMWQLACMAKQRIQLLRPLRLIPLLLLNMSSQRLCSQST